MGGLRRNHGLEALLDLDGQVYVVDPTSNHWVKFSIKRVKPSRERPHGLSYSLTLHAKDGKRLVLGSIMPTLFAPLTDPEAARGNSMTINIDSVIFDPMNTRMLLCYFRISGPKSMPCLRNGE